MGPPANEQSSKPTDARKGTLRETWLDAIVDGLGYWYLTSLIVMLGIWFGTDFVRPARGPVQSPEKEYCPLANWDGEWFAQIVDEGYSFDPARQSSVAFFPGYPLLGEAVASLTGLRTDWALVLVSQASLAAAFVVLARYAQVRCPRSSAGNVPLVLLALGLLPAGVFLRMAYSESLFLLLCVVTMYGIARAWPTLVVALVAGLATAVRPVGVALLAPLAVDVWRRSTGVPAFAARLALVAPLAMWGIAGFMLYSYSLFGDPFAFAVAHGNWHFRALAPASEKWLDLLLLEPVWSVYVPTSPAYWANFEVHANPLFSLQAANPVWFVIAMLLVIVGAWRRWLSVPEWALAAILLAIPYATRSHEMCMASMGRFTCVVFPIYFVLGNLLSRLPGPLTAAILAVAGFLLGAYAALFSAWHLFI